MNSLTNEPLASLLPKLFAEAEASEAAMKAAMRALPPAERDALTKSAKSDYRVFYAYAKDVHLAVSPASGKLLYMLARAARAKAIVEFGTSFGVSTLHLAAALRDNGGGRLVTSELEPGKVAKARANLEAGGVADLVEIREGDARETLARDLPASIDLVLLDGAKPLYPELLTLLEPRLREGAIVVADNADMAPDYLARVRDPRSGYLSTPFGEDVEVSVRA